jgi:hypothetical protein
MTTFATPIDLSDLFRVLGVIGMLIAIASLASAARARRLRAGPGFLALNLVAAALVLGSLLASGGAQVWLQAFWVLLGAGLIWQRLGRRSRPAPDWFPAE